MSQSALDLARQRLQSYLQAEAAILQSQEYTVGGNGTGRRNRRADLEQVRAGIAACQADIAQLEAVASGGRRVIRLMPL